MDTFTPDYCVLLEIPVGGQGRWHSTDQYWLLESFSDSDWSSNQTHRRSTSCGVHMLNGSFLFARSRSERVVVSLSSCEAELHSMVSTLSDGIFLRRCIQFISGGEIEHVLFTDSSSGRQLAMRQGTGKVKYLSGKILWIQDAVREGLIQLIQIPTVWNLSDIGTEALGIQRIRLLLHELNVATGDGFFELEYQAQAERHVGGRQMSKLVKQIARVLILMGLESSAPRPMAMVTDSMLDDDSFHGGVFQCSKEPNSVDQGGAFPSNTMLIFILMAVVCLCAFLFKTYRMARDAFTSYEHSYGQMAILDSAYNQVQNQDETLRREHNELQQLVNSLRRTIHELESNQEMLSDSYDELHHGLVMLGGFTSHTTFTMDQRQHMYLVERANMPRFFIRHGVLLVEMAQTWVMQKHQLQPVHTSEQRVKNLQVIHA